MGEVSSSEFDSISSANLNKEKNWMDIERDENHLLILSQFIFRQ